MRKQILFLSVLVVSFSSQARLYYSEMYEPAKSSVNQPSESVQTSGNGVIVGPVADLTSPEPENQKQTAQPAASEDKVRETTDTYTSVGTGAAVENVYHVVVGSFQSAVNAQNLCNQLLKEGKQATVAVNQNGLYRVFYMSSDSEDEARSSLTEARTAFEGAWLLKISK